MHQQGNGVAVDFNQAREWYGQAANQGLAKAQFNLGYMFANGFGIPLDFEKVVKWYHLAARQGLPVAQLELGFLHLYGKGTPQSYVDAYAWCQMAQEDENEEAKKCMEIARQEMTAGQIEAAEQLFQDIQNQMERGY